MKEKTITERGVTAVARIPSAADVDAVQVGSMAPDCFGRMALVTRVIYRKTGVHVGYICAMSPSDTVENQCGCSNSIRAGELVRTVQLTQAMNSADCDRLEEVMNRE